MGLKSNNSGTDTSFEKESSDCETVNSTSKRSPNRRKFRLKVELLNFGKTKLNLWSIF